VSRHLPERGPDALPARERPLGVGALGNRSTHHPLGAALARLAALRRGREVAPPTWRPYPTSDHDYAKTPCTSARRRYVFVDVGYILADAIRGMGSMDVAIASSAAVGSLFGDRETHLRTARGLGVPIVALHLETHPLGAGPADAEERLRAALSDAGYEEDGQPVFRFSVSDVLAVERADDDRCGEAIALLDWLDDQQPPRARRFPETLSDASDLPFAMPVEAVHVVGGEVVVCGRVARGRVRIGDVVETAGLVPAVRAEVADLRSFDRPIARGLPGDHLGCLLRGARPGDVRPGQVLGVPGRTQAFVGSEAWMRQLHPPERWPSGPPAIFVDVRSVPALVDAGDPLDDVRRMGFEVEGGLVCDHGQPIVVRTADGAHWIGELA